jgi:hypothetical protein
MHNDLHCKIPPQLNLYAEYLIETELEVSVLFLQGYGIARKFVATQGQLLVKVFWSILI